MLELMYEAKGLGLAATQVALPFQLLVMNMTGDPEQRDQEAIYVNPVIVERKGSQDGEEGCLSFPGLFQKVRRAKTVKVQAYNLKGELVELAASATWRPGPGSTRSITWTASCSSTRWARWPSSVPAARSRSSSASFAGSRSAARSRPTLQIEQILDALEMQSLSDPCPQPTPRIVMMGTGTFAEPTFEALLEQRYPVVGLVTQPDRNIGRGARLHAPDRPGHEDHRPGGTASPSSSPRASTRPRAWPACKQFQPDLLVVAAYGQILSSDVLEAAPLGGINVHASLLPKYRGAAPIAWAIYHGETQTGVTIIRMSTAPGRRRHAGHRPRRHRPRRDGRRGRGPAGPAGRSAGRAGDRADAARARCGTQAGPGPGDQGPQADQGARPDRWERTAQEVRNQVRAMQPWPTAYTLLAPPRPANRCG